MNAVGFVFILIGGGLLWVSSIGVTLAVGLGLMSLLRKERAGFWAAVILCAVFGGFLIGAGLGAMAFAPTTAGSSLGA